MANLFDWKAGKYNALMGKIAERLTPQQGDRLLANPLLIDAMLASIVSDGTNPFAISVDEILARFRQASEAQDWNID